MVRVLLFVAVLFFPLGCYQAVRSNEATTARIRREQPDYTPCGLIVLTEIGSGIFASLAAGLILMPGGLVVRQHLRGVGSR